MDDESLDFFHACQGMAFGIAPCRRRGNDDFAQKRTFARQTRYRLTEQPGFALSQPVCVGRRQFQVDERKDIRWGIHAPVGMVEPSHGGVANKNEVDVHGRCKTGAEDGFQRCLGKLRQPGAVEAFMALAVDDVHHGAATCLAEMGLVSMLQIRRPENKPESVRSSVPVSNFVTGDDGGQRTPR